MSIPPQPLPSDRPENEPRAPTEEAAAEIQVDCYDERIRVLQKCLADVQKPETLKHRTWRNLLAHSELMFDILDTIKDLHEFIGVATLPFRATLKIVLVKQENDKRIAALMVEMIDMMSALIELRNIKDTKRLTSDGKTVKGNLARVLTVIKGDIENAGNLVDCYSKAGTWDRTLRLREWSEKFRDTTITFQRGKINIQTAMNIHTSVAVEHLAVAMDAMRQNQNHVVTMMQDWFNNPQSADERRFLQLVKQHGGQGGIGTEASFIALYKEAGSGERVRESASSMDRRLDDDKDKVRAAKQEWEKIKGPLVDFLAKNRSMFEPKLELEVQTELKAAIRQSETNIIRAIHDGSYYQINHPGIRDLWKAMHWRLSVKTRHFVMALHDHYLHGTYSASSGVTLQSTEHAASLPPENSLQRTQFVDPADRWCLQYLRIQYLPAICEAFDDDGSGFVKIGEVNDFTEGIPEGWNLLKWVAYWTGAWPTDISRYSHLIQGTMARISEAQCCVKQENIELVAEYMNGIPFAELSLIVSSVKQSAMVRDSEKSELLCLAATLREQTEKALEEKLEKFDYNIDDPDTLSILCGPGRVEKYLFPLLHLLLLRHLEIVRFAKSNALDYRELRAAESSLENVLEKVSQRVRELKESFRQQKLDVNEQFKNFACGIYARYQYSNASKGLGMTPQHPTPHDYFDYSVEYSGSKSEPESESNDPEPSSQAPRHGGDSPNIPTDPVGFAQIPVAPGSLGHSFPMKDNQETLEIEPEKVFLLQETSPSLTDDTTSPVTPTSQGEQNSTKTSSSNIVQVTDPEVPKRPTRFDPFQFDTSLYSQPWSLTEETTPWRPLNVHISDIGPREMFKLAIQRVLERVQLLSPRLTWAYIQRRRSIRLQWVDVALRSDQENMGGHGRYRAREPSNEEVLDDLKLQVTPADVAYFTSIEVLQAFQRRWHVGIYCDGCYLEIYGKRFHCIDCLVSGGIDLCNDCENGCEHAETSRLDVTQHPPSHTMVQYTYPVEWSLPQAVFQSRARKYMVKHYKQPCSCSYSQESAVETTPVYCNGCQKEIRNEIHFRCLQCPDYDLCEQCERDHPPQHCISHVLLKLQAPLLTYESTGSDTVAEDEQQPLSVEDRLTQLSQRMNDLETKFESRLDEVQNGFLRLFSLLEQFDAREKRRTYLYESTKSVTL